MASSFVSVSFLLAYVSESPLILSVNSVFVAYVDLIVLPSSSATALATARFSSSVATPPATPFSVDGMKFPPTIA